MVEDPLETVKESINAPMLVRFLSLWIKHGTKVEAADPTQLAAKFSDLCEAAADIIDHVTDIAQRSEFSVEQLKWEIKHDGGPVKFSHLISLHDWLVTTGLMVGNIQQKPAPKKGSFVPQFILKHTDIILISVVNDRPAIKIFHDGKEVEMTAKMINDARLNPSMYPGCVEAGLDVVSEILTNRVCIWLYLFHIGLFSICRTVV